MGFKRRMIEAWKKSAPFRFIDKRVDRHFQKQVTNDNFSILCSNCIAGAIYHRLGKQFLTPTINLYMTNGEFIHFCLNLDYYLAQELQFIESDKPFPVAELRGDGKDIPTITINFNHDKLSEEARDKWERRKVRLNKDNLFLMFYNLDDITLDDIHKLDDYPCRNKVIFTQEPIDIPWSYYIKPNLRTQFPYAYLGKDVFGVRTLEKHFHFGNFFNC